MYLAIFFGAAAPTTVDLIRRGVVIGDALVIVGFFFICLVYRANSFTSATIEIAADQRVIGPYAIVRHPMYASALLYLALLDAYAAIYAPLYALLGSRPTLFLGVKFLT